MTQKKSYSRYFIILQEDEKGYALASDKLPSGYAKLELRNDKCKISYYVQNLKKEKTPYYMVLICNKKDVKKIIKIGELNIDDHGRAEISYEYPSENIAETSIGVDKVVGAAIVKFINSTLVPVMTGFASTDIPEWKSFIVVESELKRQDNNKQIEPEIKVEKTESVFDEYERKIEKAKVECEEKKPIEESIEITVEKPAEVSTEGKRQVEEFVKTVKEKTVINEEIKSEEYQEQTERQIDGNAEEAAREIPTEEVEEEFSRRHKKASDKHECEEDHKHEKEEHKESCKDHKHEKEEHKGHCDDHKPEKECYKVPCNEHKQEYHDCSEEEKEKDHKEHHQYHVHEEYPKGNVGEFFLSLVDEFEEHHDACKEIKRCRWFKIPAEMLENISGCMDYNKYTVLYYPMLSYYTYLKKHNHYMVGYKCDKDNKLKYLVYGVPGTKKKCDQPYGGKSGFVTWVPLRAGEEEEDSFGYWLMFYDFRNSTIVIPVK